MRSQLNINVVIQDVDGVLSVVEGAEVTVEQSNGGTVNVYSAATGGTTVSQPISSDAQGRADGWVEDGRYKITIDNGGDITQRYREYRSGGEVKVFKDGFPGTTDYPQIMLDEDGSGSSPAILLGSGAAAQDIQIKRTGAKEITLDAVSTDTGKVIIKGDVQIGGSGKVVSVSGNRLRDVGNPLGSSDAANKGYVDAYLSSLDNDLYAGYVHNLPLSIGQASLSNLTVNKVYATLTAVPSSAVVSSISVLRGSGTSSPTVQFGLFAEVLDGATHNLVCIAATEKSSSSWAATTFKTLTVGYYDGATFFPDSYIYDPTTLPEFSTGNLYIGVVTDTAFPLTGASITSPIVTTDLGLPMLAGESATTFDLSSSTLTPDLDAPSTVTFPSSRSGSVPFVRVKVS